MHNGIYPCIWFDGQAKAAAEFYCTLFPNSKITADTPMVVNFELNGTRFMALNGGPQFKINPSISMFVRCASIDDTNTLWARLIEGGSVMMPIDKYSWSERYGWVKDKFGLTWQVSVVDKEGDKPGITPSFLFTKDKFGRTQEALTYYTSVFSDSAIDMLLAFPEGDINAGKVMFSSFRLGDNPFIAMESPGAHEFTFNEAVSLVIDCHTQEEIDYYWDKLTDGGKESMCGWLVDRFGVSWQVVPNVIGKLMQDPDKARRVMPVLLQMKKLDIKKLMEA